MVAEKVDATLGTGTVMNVIQRAETNLPVHARCKS
ncbi:hypothetical protein BSTP3_274 [Bacillus phage BSTP3]|nr:hypothetical protein BSTP3_274 [Bacillus phage BSTP3]